MGPELLDEAILLLAGAVLECLLEGRSRVARSHSRSLLALVRLQDVDS